MRTKKSKNFRRYKAFDIPKGYILKEVLSHKSKAIIIFELKKVGNNIKGK